MDVVETKSGVFIEPFGSLPQLTLGLSKPYVSRFTYVDSPCNGFIVYDVDAKTFVSHIKWGILSDYEVSIPKRWSNIIASLMKSSTPFMSTPTTLTIYARNAFWVYHRIHGTFTRRPIILDGLDHNNEHGLDVILHEGFAYIMSNTPTHPRHMVIIQSITSHKKSVRVVIPWKYHIVAVRSYAFQWFIFMLVIDTEARKMYYGKIMLGSSISSMMEVPYRDDYNMSKFRLDGYHNDDGIIIQPLTDKMALFEPTYHVYN